MKKRLLASVLVLLFLSGCSMLEEVNDSLDYSNEAVKYVESLQTFAEKIPGLAQEAVKSKEAHGKLEKELEKMNNEISQFNEMEAPAVASSIHDKIVDYNNQLSEKIDTYLENVKNGNLDPAFLENSKILDTINQITELRNNLEKIGG